MRNQLGSTEFGSFESEFSSSARLWCKMKSPKLGSSESRSANVTAAGSVASCSRQWHIVTFLFYFLTCFMSSGYTIPENHISRTWRNMWKIWRYVGNIKKCVENMKGCVGNMWAIWRNPSFRLGSGTLKNFDLSTSFEYSQLAKHRAKRGARCHFSNYLPHIDSGTWKNPELPLRLWHLEISQFLPLYIGPTPSIFPLQVQPVGEEPRKARGEVSLF